MTKDVDDWTSSVVVRSPVAQGSKTTAGAGAESFTTTAFPTGAQTLGIAIEGASGFVTSLKVVGHTSATVYESPTGSTAEGGWIQVPINTGLDSQYDISWATSSGAGTVVAAFSTSLVPGFPTLGQSAMGESVPVAIASDQSAVQVKGSLGGINSSGASAVAGAAYDATGTSAPATGSQASVVLAAVPGKAYTCALIVASLVNSAAAASGFHLQLLDGATVLLDLWMGVTAVAGNSDTVHMPGLAFKGTVGNSMTLKFAAGLAAIDQSVTIGAYLQ